MKGKAKTRTVIAAGPPAAERTPHAPASAAKAPVKSYEPNAHERAAIERYRQRRDAKPPPPHFKVEYEGSSVTITPDHVEPAYVHALLADMVATGDYKFSCGLLDQVANVARTGKQLTSRDLNFALATVNAIGPRDPIESLLAAQMFAIHKATMVAARVLANAENIPQQDSASNALNKLARTFAAQIETLKRYRADGEQKVTVQHQHVNVSSNHAVVGISQGGGGAHEKSSQPHVPSGAHEQSPPMLGHEQALPMPMSGAGSDRLARVPVPRCAERSTEGKGQRRVAARNGDQ
ncbi:MAG: hypothetical protein ACKVP7_17280 [Hyphomicrobiaceae bacterium]